MRERGIIDDLKWALAVLAGFVLGFAVFGGNASLLLGPLIGVTLVVMTRAILRRRRRASNTRSPPPH